MHRSRILTLFFCLTGMAAALLAWVTQSLLGETTYLKGIDPGYSITQMNMGDGWLTLFCFLLIIILMVTGKRKLPAGRRSFGGLPYLLSSAC